MTIKVVIADDHPFMRDGLRLLIDQSGEIQVVGEAANGREAVVMCSYLRPQVVIMDYKMPVMDGLTATRHIRQAHPGIRIIAFTMADEPSLNRRFMEAGASAVLAKDSNIDELTRAIQDS